MVAVRHIAWLHYLIYHGFATSYNMVALRHITWVRYTSYNILVVFMPLTNFGYDMLVRIILFALKIYRQKFELLLLLLLKKVGSARQRESDIHPINQSEDHRPTIPTYRQKEKKGKKSRRL